MQFLRRIFSLVIIGSVFLVGYTWRNEIRDYTQEQINFFVPCTFPITYSIVNFDERFKITKSDFVKYNTTAEKIWEQSAGKELFQYVETGGMIEINLIYDNRQAATDSLKEIRTTIDGNQDEYETLKNLYDTLSQEFKEQKKKFQKDSASLEALKREYEQEVEYWNSQWGAPEKDYSVLEQKRQTINAQVITLNNEQKKINDKAATINNLAAKINDLIKKLNLNVAKFNTTRVANGEEFDEGEYIRDAAGKRINIYQFSSKEKLSRVLTHEFGHVLWLEHVDDSEAIMYRLNEGKVQELTEADINELKSVCRLK